jgi:multidrug efflux system membrane fusion protein
MSRTRWFFVLAAVLAGGLAVWRVRAGAQRSQVSAAQSAASARDRPVPVILTAVSRRDVPLYLEGLGTVTAYNTVTIRTRIEGRLDRVFFTEGQTVRRGDLLAQLDPRPFQIQARQADAVVARDRALVATNQRVVDRHRTLLQGNFLAQAEIDASLGALEQSRASLRASEALAASARLNLDFARITSPLEGVTGLRQVDPGNIVRPSDANGLVIVRQIDPIAVLFTLPQDELPRVSAEMARRPLPVELFNRDGSASLVVGTLAVIDNQVQQATGTIRLKAVFANPQRTLWPDQFVRARLLLTTLRGATVVPAVGVQRGPQGTFAYVVDADNRVAVRPIEVSRIEGDVALITRGLQVGEQLVTEGTSRLRAGARVSPRAAGPDGGAGSPAEVPGARQGRRRRGDAGVGARPPQSPSP